MNIEEFKKSNVEIDTELSNLLKAELFTVEVRPVYKEKYKSLLNRALHIADPELVEHLARKLFEVILNDYIAKKFHKAYNEVAVPAFNMQYESPLMP